MLNIVYLGAIAAWGAAVALAAGCRMEVFGLCVIAPDTPLGSDTQRDTSAVAFRTVGRSSLLWLLEIWRGGRLPTFSYHAARD